MVVTGAKAIYLGFTEREAQGDKRAWAALDYAVVGENASRRTFLDRSDMKMMATARNISAGDWAGDFSFDGDIDSRGNVTFTALYESDGIL